MFTGENNAFGALGAQCSETPTENEGVMQGVEISMDGEKWLAALIYPSTGHRTSGFQS